MKSVFEKPERYLAYASKTNEKRLLHEYLQQEHQNGKLPLKPGYTGKVLDLGCGTGINTKALAEIFEDCDITAIDKSPQMLRVAEKFQNGILYVPKPFEDLVFYNFDFILASHVLQYIDTDVRSFIRKIYEALSAGGEAWIVQQTRRGMFSLISHQRDFLESPIFSNWMTFEDYVRIVDELGFNYETTILPTSFQGIDFKDPSESDRRRLEFVFCLDRGFDDQPTDFRQHLSELGYRDRIFHPNGIIKIRK